MIFKHSRFAFIQYVFKRLEMALGLALILMVAVSEFWLTQTQAIIFFIAVVAIRIPSVLKGVNEIKYRQIKIIDNQLIEIHKDSETRYKLDEFKVLLYKKRRQSIPVFVVMNETGGIKLEYFDDMPALYEILSNKVSLRKELPWWQRI
jgi:hypothetical protein